MIKNCINLFKGSSYKYKYDLLSVLIIILIMPFVYILFYYVIGTKQYLGIAIVAISIGKIFTGFLAEIVEPNFGNQKFTPLLKLIGYSMQFFILFFVIFLLIKDANQNESVLNHYDEKTTDNTQTNVAAITDKQKEQGFISATGDSLSKIKNDIAYLKNRSKGKTITDKYHESMN